MENGQQILLAVSCFFAFFLYESLYNSLNYFYSLLWGDLEDGIPRRPVAVYTKL